MEYYTSSYSVLAVACIVEHVAAAAAARHCMVLVHFQPVVIVIVCHAIATDGGVGGVLDQGLCLDRSVALTLEGLIWPHSMVATFHGGWIWLQISLCG